MISYKEPIRTMRDRILKLGLEITFLDSLPVTEIRSRIIYNLKMEVLEFESAISCLANANAEIQREEEQ